MLRYGFALVLFSVPATSALAAPVLWDQIAGGNGHYYERVAPSGGITWTDARTAAAAATYNGMPGHLATFSSASEFSFVCSTFPSQLTWIGFTDEQTEGTWRWVTGEPTVYTAWLTYEPNNSATNPPGEDYAWYEDRGQGWGWNDYQNRATVIVVNDPIGYVVEYQPVPEPSTVLAGIGLAVLTTSRRREIL